MRSFYRVLAAEVLKLKRTLALRLSVFSPLIVVILVFGMYAVRGQQIGGADPLTGFAQLVLTVWTIIMFPLFAALVAALIAAIEHQNETWKHPLAFPVDRSNVFVAKWLTGSGLLLLSSFFLCTGVCLAAEILRLMRPDWRTASLPIPMIFRGTILSCCAVGLLFSIQMWISLRWRSFLPGIFVAVIALVLMFIAIPRGAALFGSLFPWSLPAMAMSPHNVHRPLAAGWGLLGGVLVAVLACWNLSRREFS
jgi:hypothetical protein